MGKVGNAGVNSLVKAIFNSAGEEVSTQEILFSRSLSEVLGGEKDFHFPIIKTKGNSTKLHFSSETAYYITFYLYFHKDKPIEHRKLLEGAYKIDTEFSHKSSFDFNVQGVTCIECSVKKLNSGRIDGVLYPKFLVEKLIKKNGLINLERIAFKQFEVKFVYSPQTNISKLDEIISKGIKKLRKENKLQIILNREVEVKSKQNFLY